MSSLQQKIQEIINCQHEFGEIIEIERGFRILTLRIRTSKQHYRICKKCGVARHEEDGDLFFIFEGKYVEINKEKGAEK